VASIIMAFIGQFPVITHGTQELFLYPYTWNTNASVLFLDNPAGVGFSYGKTDQDLTHTDEDSARDAFTFFKQWAADWPELRNNSLYIAGWSYGGVFAPYLTYAIHNYNAELQMYGGQPFNLKGMIIANGGTDWNYTPDPPPVD